MPGHWRTPLYLAAAAVIWFAEDFIFTRQLHFNVLQTAVVTTYFVIVFAFAVRFVVRAYRHPPSNGDRTTDDVPLDRIVAIAPMFTVVVGSFAALPVLMLALFL